MEIRATLSPGQNGTKSLLKQYGDPLVCVRYRYDKARQKRYQTVALVVEEKAWIPHVVIPAEKRVLLRIDFNEPGLRERVKAAGAYWNPDKKAWQVRDRTALELGLDRRIIDAGLDF